MDLFYVEKILVNFKAVSLHSDLAELQHRLMTKGAGLIFRIKYLRVDINM